MKMGSMGLLGALILGLGVSPADADSRLQWGGARIDWHEACAFSHDADHDADRHRFAVIRGTLRSMARGDASLYAVFLESKHDLHTLKLRLQTERPTQWQTEPASSSLPCQWVPMAANGSLTLHVDEAHQSGKNLVAIVNGEGEILGVRDLWSAGDLAQAQIQ